MLSLSAHPPEPSHRIAAVIVAYRPELPLLCQLIAAVRPQVDALWLVNNGLPSDLAELDADAQRVNLVQFADNLGIGAAIGYAIERAQAEGHTFLLTLDQDSIPASDMVQQLLATYLNLVTQGLSVAGVGPEQIDRRSGRHAPFMAPICAWPSVRHSIFPPMQGVIEVDHLITSGLLVPLSVYQAVGAPRADLFIDYVDIEWSLRARRNGFHLFAVGNAQLMHSIGDSFKQFMGKQVPIHSPLRHYYLMRNGVYLQKLPTISFAWKISDAFQLLKKFIFFSLFLPDRGKRLCMMLRGISDGLSGKLGIYRERS
jgi:rhamnosyltransferase